MSGKSPTFELPSVAPCASMSAAQPVALLLSFSSKAGPKCPLDTTPTQAPAIIFNSSAVGNLQSNALSDAISSIGTVTPVTGDHRVNRTIGGGLQPMSVRLCSENVPQSCSATSMDVLSNQSSVNSSPIGTPIPTVTDADNPETETDSSFQQVFVNNLAQKLTNTRLLSLPASDDCNLHNEGGSPIFHPIFKSDGIQTVKPKPHSNVTESHCETTRSIATPNSCVTAQEAGPAAAFSSSLSTNTHCSLIIAVSPGATAMNTSKSPAQRNIATGTFPLLLATENRGSVIISSGQNLPLREAPVDPPNVPRFARRSDNAASRDVDGVCIAKKKVFPCTTCDKVYRSAWGLKVHNRMHTSGPLFRCKFCKYQAVTNSALLRHLRKHSHERPFSCNLCKKLFKSKYALKIHFDLHAGRKSHGCKICGKKFVQKSALRYHLVVHKSEMAEKECSATSDNEQRDEKYQFESMERIHEDKGSDKAELVVKQAYSCCYCAAKEISREEMARHVYLFHRSKMASCSLCTFYCVSRSTLGDHWNVVHSDACGDYVCCYCRKGFSAYLHLLLHYPTHFISRSPGKSFLSHDSDIFYEKSCGKKRGAIQKRSINTIIYSKIYNDASKLVCKICFHVSANFRLLKLHEKTHTKAKAITCSECFDIFWKKKEYLIHSKRHNELFSRRECRVCHRTLTSVLRMCAHERTCRVPHCRRSFECPSCGEELPSLTCFVTHVYLFHLEIPSNNFLRDQSKANLSSKISSKFSFQHKPQVDDANRTTSLMKNTKFKSGIVNSGEYFGKIISCVVCDKFFENKEHFSRHWRAKCSFNSEAIQCAHLNRTTAFICSWCGRTFVSFELMTEHELHLHLAHEQTVFSCRLCGKRYLNRDHCFSHFRTCGLAEDAIFTDVNRDDLEFFYSFNPTCVRSTVEPTYKGSVITMYDCEEVGGGKLELEMFFNGEAVSYVTLVSEMNSDNMLNLYSETSLIRFRKRSRKWKLSQ